MPVIHHIHGGSLFAYQGQSSLALQGTDFAIQFQLGDLGSIPLPQATSQGATLDPSGTLAGDQTLRFGTVDVSGVLHAKLWFTGALQMHASPFVVPANSPHPIHHSTHFTLDGSLQAYHNNPTIGNPGPAVFDFQVAGHGTVVVRMSPFSSGSRTVTSYFYSFT